MIRAGWSSARRRVRGGCSFSSSERARAFELGSVFVERCFARVRPRATSTKCWCAFLPRVRGRLVFLDLSPKRSGTRFEASASTFPGRPGARRREPLGFQTSVQEIAEAVARGIEDTYRDAEVALFGHSLGAWMAFECALALAETAERSRLGSIRERRESAVSRALAE